MGVHLNVLGHVVVDDQGDVLAVDTTTRHVGHYFLEGMRITQLPPPLHTLPSERA